MYFDKYVTLVEFAENSIENASISLRASLELKERVDSKDRDIESVKIVAATPSDERMIPVSTSDDTDTGPISREEATRRLHKSAEMEAADMKPVPWTTQNNPEGRANIFSRLVVGWMSPLFWFAHKHTIEESDIWELRAYFRSLENFYKFESIWLEEKKKASIVPKGKKTRPLANAIVRCFGLYFATAAPLLAIQNISQLALPFLLGPLIKFMANSEPEVNGWMYSLGFFVALMCMTISENQYFDRTMKTGLLVRAR